MNKYDWSNVPSHIMWIATDYDGAVFGYMGMHNNSDSDFMWYGVGAISLELDPYQGNWQDSLEDRPNDI